MNIKTNIKLFLEDRTSFHMESNGDVFQKVPLSNTLTILLYSDKFNLDKSDLEFVGVYSHKIRDFLLLANAYCNRKAVARDKDYSDDEVNSHTLVELQKDLQSRVQDEIWNALNMQVKPNMNFSSELLEKAKECIHEKKTPKFKFKSYKPNIDLLNLEEFCDDRDEFAYDIAEKIICDDNACVKEYQEYVDLLAAIEYLNNNTPIDFELQNEIENVIKNSNKQNFKLEVIDGDGYVEIIEKLSEKDILAYPLYAIKKILWGRSILFNIDDYPTDKIADLRTDIEYNTKAFINCFSHFRSTFLKYVDKSVFCSIDYCKNLCNYSLNDYYRIDESLRSNINFIKMISNSVSSWNLFQYTPETVLLANKNFFLNLMNNRTVSTSYKVLPKSLQNDEEFMLKFIELNGQDAIRQLDENAFNNPAIQTAFDDYFLSHPVHPFSRHHLDPLPVYRLTNRRTKILALSIYELNSISDDDLNDESFIIEFIDRIHDVGEYDDTFYTIYNQLKGLTKNYNIIKYLLEKTKLSDNGWNLINDSFKADKDLQRLAVENNNNLLYMMDDDIKAEFLKKDAKTFIPFTISSMKHRTGIRYNDKLFLDALKNGQPKALIHMTYSQKSDIKFANQLLDISLDAYEYLSNDLKNNIDIARKVVKDHSIINLLPEKSKYQKDSLFDNKEIMKASLAHEPLDFSDILPPSRSHGPAPLLEDKDFILYAVSLEPYNAVYIPAKSKFREDEDVCYTTLMGDVERAMEFSSKIYRNENFVYRLCEGLKEQIENNKTTGHIILKEVQNVLIPMIPKKIRNTKAFETKFPNFKEMEETSS